MDMPKIIRCDVVRCSYNKKNECHALAITVGDATHPQCDTFSELGVKGGDPSHTGRVGACKVTVCKFNQSLECSAPGIAVGQKANEIDCLTFHAK